MMKANVVFERYSGAARFPVDFDREGTPAELVAFADAAEPGEYATIRVATDAECAELRAAGWRGALDIRHP